MTNPHEAEIHAAFKPAPTIEERRARLKRVREMVSTICKNPREWRMCIPVQPDDTDIVLSAALTDARASLDELEQLHTRIRYLEHYIGCIPFDAIRAWMPTIRANQGVDQDKLWHQAEDIFVWLADFGPEQKVIE